VAGLRTRKASDWDRAAAGFAPGRPVEVEVLRHGERLTMELRPGTPFPWVRFGITAIAVAAYLGLALLILLQGRRDIAPRLLFAFSLAVAVEMALPVAAIGNVALGAVALTAYYLLTGLEIGLELHLASVIPERRRFLARHRWIVPAYYTAGVGLGSLTGLTLLLEDVVGLEVFPWTSGQIEALLLRLALPLWAVGVVALLAVPAFTHPVERQRRQAGLVLAGVVPWALFVLVTTLVAESLLVQLVWLQVVESLVLLCYPVAVFVAIFRYELFDVGLAVRKSLLFGTLTGALILVFYAALGVGGAVFSQLVEERGSVWAIAAATLVLGLLFAPLLRALELLLDRRLFPERHALRARLIALASELPALGKLPRMGDHLGARITDIFGARFVILLLADPANELLEVLVEREVTRAAGVDRALLLSLRDPAVESLQRSGRPVAVRALAGSPAAAGSALLARLSPLGAELLVPLVGHDRLVGVMVLGPRLAGEPYRGEEVELLHLLSHHVAQVFENARLFESATYESLTGLLRREAILERLEQELTRALRHDRPLTVGLADLDHFKEVNDRFGHLAGDSLLKRVAEALSDSLRDTDSVGRYGGEEFLLVLPETSVPGARVAAEKMRQAVESVQLVMADGSEVSVTISIGLASLDDLRDRRVALTPREFIAAADAALYRAKRAGRNRVHTLLSAAG
jgi:diguanylate cyclase (GGDEF)-like protein